MDISSNFHYLDFILSVKTLKSDIFLVFFHLS